MSGFQHGIRLPALDSIEPRRSPRRQLTDHLIPYAGPHPEPVPDLTLTKRRRVLIAYAIDDLGMLEGYQKTLAPLPALWGVAIGVPQAAISEPRKTLLPDVVVEGEAYHGSSVVPLATRNSRVTQFDMVAPDNDRRVRVLVLDRSRHFWPNPTQTTIVSGAERVSEQREFRCRVAIANRGGARASEGHVDGPLRWF